MKLSGRFLGLILTATLALACVRTARPSIVEPFVEGVAVTVSELSSERGFFSSALGFRPLGQRPLVESLSLFGLPQPEGTAAELSAEAERLWLYDFETPPLPVPEPARSNDLWFQHIAIVVDDLDAAVAQVEKEGGRPVSRGPQTLPLSNPAAGGIRAYYFRDPDGHNLELIWYPRSRGDARWHRPAPQGRHTLGLDHTAIAVSDTERSLRFWKDGIGLHVAGESFNFGPEQEALSGVPGARVRITALRGNHGLGVELLEYVAPRDGRPSPADLRATDLAHWEVTVRVPDLEAVLARLERAGFRSAVPSVDVASLGLGHAKAARLRDPDGHFVRLVQ